MYSEITYGQCYSPFPGSVAFFDPWIRDMLIPDPGTIFLRALTIVLVNNFYNSDPG
jgi:hypothetical protein